MLHNIYCSNFIAVQKKKFANGIFNSSLFDPLIVPPPCKSESPLPNDHPCQVWFHLIEQFCRKRIKCEKVSDDGRQITKHLYGHWAGAQWYTFTVEKVHKFVRKKKHQYFTHFDWLIITVFLDYTKCMSRIYFFAIIWPSKKCVGM